MPNDGLQRTALRTAVDAERSAVEMATAKYEKTAMQWLQEQTKNN